MKASAPSPAPAAPDRPNDRNAYIDTLRGWSIFGVVCVHFAGSFVTTDAHAWSPSFHLGLALNQVFSCAVPMFVFLSGLLAGASRRQPGLGEYYAGRFRRIAVPYLIASVPAFFLLNHYPAWEALPTIGEKLHWLVTRLFFYGVEPTLYFIPLILQLYLLQPFLRALPQWLHRLAPFGSPAHWAAACAGLLLAVHVTVGLLCDRGVLNYYTWGRPNPLFWAFYFFAGLHFTSLATLLSSTALRRLAWICGILALGAMAWNAHLLLDRAAMGENFQFNRLDFAYVRPEIIVYNLGAVFAFAVGVPLGWLAGGGLFSYLGRFTLEIYLWHILVLYFGAWRYHETLQACRSVPELIVLICLGATVLIALAADLWQRSRAYLRTHRIVVQRRE